jgi:DNA-binding HxlR family transcriptional regulator
LGSIRTIIVLARCKGHPFISRQILINQLRELEEDKILEHIVFAKISPKVDHKDGKTLLPLISVIQEWGLVRLEAKLVLNNLL